MTLWKLEQRSSCICCRVGDRQCRVKSSGGRYWISYTLTTAIHHLQQSHHGSIASSENGGKRRSHQIHQDFSQEPVAVPNAGISPGPQSILCGLLCIAYCSTGRHAVKQWTGRNRKEERDEPHDEIRMTMDGVLYMYLSLYLGNLIPALFRS